MSKSSKQSLSFMRPEEELKLKTDINVQLAINGFIRRQLIQTQIDKQRPIKVINNANQTYASLADTKKVLIIKEDMRHEIAKDLKIQGQGQKLRQSQNRLNNEIMDLTQKVQVDQLKDQDPYQMKRNRPLKSNNGLLILGGYKDYLQDRHGTIYRNSTFTDPSKETQKKGKEQSLLQPQNVILLQKQKQIFESTPMIQHPDPKLEIIGNPEQIYSSQNVLKRRPHTAVVYNDYNGQRSRPKSAYSGKTTSNTNENQGQSFLRKGQKSQNFSMVQNKFRKRGFSGKSSKNKINGWNAMSSFGAGMEITPNNEDLDLTDF
ncbi:UNKNOWN [Stylonychia lemnae]|uniref:Uncharacterized protein n=1 Tax=Stylonychia lemnae TaxID=5949 RepID=A0A078A2Z1_STYLE|nr:UNKNOWN [Stylonychia lemnae]|eukprot:CDW76197.1 UNKNOWN [Stylonychia lemnae]